MLETSCMKTCPSSLNGSGSLLERKRLQLGFLTPPTSEIGDAVVSISSPDHCRGRFHGFPMNSGDEIETPPYNAQPLEDDPTEECTDKFSPSVFSLGGQPERLLTRYEASDENHNTISSTFSHSVVEFSEQVYVHFYSTESPTTTVSERLNHRQVGRVKCFDGRSDCERGVLFDDCIDLYLQKMSSKRYVDEVDDDDDDDDDAMDRDILFCCEENENHRDRRRRRPRFYAADETTIQWMATTPVSINEEDDNDNRESSSGGSLLWLMENTPCDCDLLLVGG